MLGVWEMEKTIVDLEAIAQDYARRVAIRTDEIILEKSTNKQLLGLKKLVDNEIKKRKLKGEIT